MDRRWSLAISAGVLCALLTACGIPMQEEPVPLPSSVVPEGIVSPGAVQP